MAIDGDVLVVGAQDDQDEFIGSAYIYRRSGSMWTQEAKLAPDDSNLEDFGWYVAIKGNIIAVSDCNEGAIFIYEFDSLFNSWIYLQVQVMNDKCDAYFGSTLAFSQDGGLLIGCTGDVSNTGAVFYYTSSSGEGQYVFQQKFVASDGAPDDHFGRWGTVAVDGNVMVVGTPEDPSRGVYLFTKQDDLWVEVHKINSPDESSHFGGRVALSGNKLIVASSENAYSYTLY